MANVRGSFYKQKTRPSRSNLAVAKAVTKNERCFLRNLCCMSHFNRVAALLDGCPDPGGVLYPRPAATVGSPGAPPPRHAELPKVTELILPAVGVTARQLAELLGLPLFAVHREFVNLGLLFLLDAIVPRAAVHQLCSRLGVSVTS